MRQTREQYLNRAVSALRPLFKRAGLSIPKSVLVSVGWPSRRPTPTVGAGHVIGQCWQGTHCQDEVPHIFVSPMLKRIAALDTLVHELVHSCMDIDAGHGPKFAKACNNIGLTNGKPTQASAGAPLMRELKALKLGAYPHKIITPNSRTKKQTTRLLKVECDECGYVARVTSKWINDAGAPLCPCNEEPMTVAD